MRYFILMNLFSEAKITVSYIIAPIIVITFLLF